MGRLRIALSTLGLTGRPKQVLDWIAESGFREIELPVEGRPFGLAELDASGLRDLQHHLATRFLVPVAVFARVPGALNRSSEAEVAVGRVKDLALRYAVPLRLPLVLEIDELSQAEDASEEVIREALRDLREMLEHFEIHANLTASLVTLRRVAEWLAEVNTPFLGLALDPKTFVEVEADWEFWLQEWGERIGHVYAVDARLEEGLPVPVRLGEGSVPWQLLADYLDQHDYSGPVVIRVDGHQDPFHEAVRAKQFLEKLFA